MSAPIRITDVVVGGVRSRVREAGPAAAREAVVFVHGNPGSGEDWVSLLGQVGVFGRAVAVDLPGFGRAEKPDDFDYTVDGYARHLGGVLDTLGVDRAHLVLHDFGGLWGLQWAADHPDGLASVVLLGIGVMPGYSWHRWARVWRTPLLGEVSMRTGTRAAFRKVINSGHPRGLPDRFVDRMYDDYDAGTRRAVLRLYRATDDPGALGVALGKRLRPLDRPALVLWGAHDAYLPVAYAERQREVFPRAEVHVLEESGHWLFADAPSETAGLVVPFLRRMLNAPEP